MNFTLSFFHSTKYTKLEQLKLPTHTHTRNKKELSCVTRHTHTHPASLRRRPAKGALPPRSAATMTMPAALGHDESHEYHGNSNSHATNNGPKGWIIQIGMAFLFLWFDIPKDGTAAPNVEHDETC